MNRRSILQYIKKKKGLIELTGMNEIKLNAGYCEDAIEVIRRFFRGHAEGCSRRFASPIGGGRIPRKSCRHLPISAVLPRNPAGTLSLRFIAH